MKKISSWKMVLTILFIIIAIAYVVPSLIKKKCSWLPENKINLGLDLKGGSHLLLDVDFEHYLEFTVESIAYTLKKYLRQKKVIYKNFLVSKDSIKFNIRSLDNLKEIKNTVKKIDKTLTMNIVNNVVTINYNKYQLDQLQSKVIDQSIEIIRMRVDSNGTKEPTIQRQGTKHILLQLPGEENPQYLKNLLGKIAKLTFHLVDETADIQKASNGYIPSGSRVVKLDKSNIKKIIVVRKKVIVSGNDLNTASVSFGKDSTPVVNFSFNHSGAKKFSEATNKNCGKRLAIILDGKIISDPIINEPILGGEGIISGNFTIDSASELALLLRAGALPTQLKVIEEKVIGPNLGSDSIKAGKIAALVGFLLVVTFMIILYGILGIFAGITLIIDLSFILALLSILQATLTLPGIAGIVLTIGMAVDANVLIYERIREELNKGYSNLYSVKIGFESAFGTIMDSNVTTLIASSFLYMFGTGSTKGFAVTLTIGIISSMYGALIITKLMIDLWLKYTNFKSLGLVTNMNLNRLP